MSFWQQLPLPIIGLAPMDGVTDAAFRQIVARHGNPDVIFTEFTHVGDLFHGQPKAFEAFRYSENERPIVAQLYGKDPDQFYTAAQVVCALGFDGLDINMGCPSKNVASSGSGAGLIKTPELALAIMASARQGIFDWASGQSLAEGGVKTRVIDYLRHSPFHRTETCSRQPIPLSVKTRLGYDSVIIDEWSQCLIAGRPTVISIHGRTLTQMYKGAANWEAIGQVSETIRNHGILLLGNGDIQSLPDALSHIRQHAVDGILIGRAALGNPWIFQAKNLMREAIQQGTNPCFPEPLISRDRRFSMALEHARLFETLQEHKYFPRMRKHLAWYCSGFPHAAALRAQMVRTTASEDIERILSDFQATDATAHLSEPIASTTS
ncbi:MAG: hypothetical protein GKS05_04480 [Nitrospirales bacterium]|nr:hypothetical protein [Nitrospirales bacterium]